MTPKIIELKQAPVVLVELPEHESIGRMELKWDSPLMDGGHKVRLLNNRRHIGAVGLAKHFNEDSILGILSDLDEEQFAECVDTDDQYGVVMYRNYKTTSMPYYDEQINAKQSFLSLLESENVYTENPVKVHTWASENADEYYRIWKEAQSQTIDPKRTVVLLKK